MNSAKTKKKPKHEKVVLLNWDSIAKLPLALFHTSMGPMMGHIGKAIGSPPPFDKIRLYAPSLLRTMPGKVAFLPIAFAEQWLDLSTATPSATSPVPPLVAEAYADYFEMFRQGKYSLVAAPLDAAGPAIEKDVAQQAPLTVDTVPPPANGNGVPATHDGLPERDGH